VYRLLKAAVLGAGLLIGLAGTAFAQSVASLPPTEPSTAAAATKPAVLTAKIFPDPGTNSSWKEEHYQATQSDKDPGKHPYTMDHFGPAPN
jgi:hypothetical protein